METLDDQIHIPWRGLISLSGDCNSGTRASSYPGAGRIRLSLSQRWFGNCIHAISATRSSCRRWRSSRRQGISTAFPFIGSGTRDCNQTLVGAGRPPPAACSRRSRIDLCISADPWSGRRERRPQDQQRLPRLLNVPTLSCTITAKFYHSVIQLNLDARGTSGCRCAIVPMLRQQKGRSRN